MNAFLGLALFFVGCVALEFEENDGIHLHEGDIKLNPLQQVSLDFYGDPTKPLRLARGMTSNTTLLWTTGVVPYVVSSDLQQIPEAMAAIKAGIQEWEERTCLKFVQRDPSIHPDYIEMFIGSGCWSYVGRQGGKQQLSLKSGCWSVGTVAHEIAHAMGIWHEQSRPDRDNHVSIVWANIPEKKRHNFNKRTTVDSFGVPYDYLSVMHYSATAFSSNGQPTIVAKDPNAHQLGQRVGLSASDEKQIDLLYKCKGTTTRPRPTPRPYPIPSGAADICDFDTQADTCGFTNDNNDDFDWTQRLGKTPSGNTGPPADHTTGRWGWFMYIETSSPRVQGHRAVLRSKEYPSTNNKDRCFHFYYHMLGQHVGSLIVELESNAKVVELMNKSGLSEDKWQRADIQLPNEVKNFPYRISFTGVRGDGYQGDIAIDDVYFTDGKC